MNPSIIVDVDVNIAAALLALGVLGISFWTMGLKDKRNQLFLSLAGFNAAISLISVALEFIEGPAYHGSRLLAVLLNTLLEVSINGWAVIWLLYIMYAIYKSPDYLKRKFWFYAAPFQAFVILDIVNCFTGVLWYYDENLIYHETIFYYIQDLGRYIFILAALFEYIRFRRRNRAVRFFSVWMFVIPIIAGSVLEFLTGYMLFGLGLSIGTAMMYLEVSNELGFIDRATGFNNRSFLNYLLELTEKGSFHPASLAVFEFPDKNTLDTHSDILRKVLPEDCEAVRTGGRHVLALFETADQGLLYMLSEDVSMIMEEYGIEVKASSRIRKKDKEEADFLKEGISRVLSD